MLVSRRRVAAATLGAFAAFTLVGQAMAFECFVENKHAGGGSVGTVDIATDEFVPTKNNPGTEEKPRGGFVTLDFGGQSVHVFLHIPQGGPNADNHEIPPVANGVQNNGDGKGLGELAAYFAS